MGLRPVLAALVGANSQPSAPKDFAQIPTFSDFPTFCHCCGNGTWLNVERPSQILPLLAEKPP